MIKNLIRNSNVYILFLLVYLLASCKDSNVNEPITESKYGPKTLELINPDKNTNPAQTFDEYYAFVTWEETCMPWSILPNTPYTSLYDKIDQSLNYFYFINDQPLSELNGSGLYNNSMQNIKPYTDWFVSFNKAWGSYLDTPQSWKNEY